MGDLDLEHLRKVTLPPVVQYLEDQFKEEGGTHTGRGYKIQKILDEIKGLGKEPEKEPESPGVNVTFIKKYLANESKRTQAPETPPEPEESFPLQWLWLIAALLVAGVFTALVLRRK